MPATNGSKISRNRTAITVIAARIAIQKMAGRVGFMNREHERVTCYDPMQMPAGIGNRKGAPCGVAGMPRLNCTVA